MTGLDFVGAAFFAGAGTFFVDAAAFTGPGFGVGLVTGVTADLPGALPFLSTLAITTAGLTGLAASAGGAFFAGAGAGTGGGAAAGLALLAGSGGSGSSGSFGAVPLR